MPKKQVNKKDVKVQITQLFAHAEQIFSKNKEQANKIITKARRIAMKYRMSLPTQWKRRICKHCYKFLKPGVNSRVRISNGKIVILCMECKKFTRIPVGKRFNR
ncbi:MAG TPA: ribonuclease P [Candidatus Nanoarchaeia archaeon]|nr:ribonuclease P [Candidatus Nanoarchaeia archaeon]